MTANPYGGHQAERVLGADPLELVVILYEELLGSVLAARRELAAGRPLERARAVTRAMEIITELAQAVRPAAHVALAERLLALYAFLIDRLQQANFQQRDQPLAECELIVRTLLEAWRTASTARFDSPAPTHAHALASQPAPISICG